MLLKAPDKNAVKTYLNCVCCTIKKFIFAPARNI